MSDGAMRQGAGIEDAGIEDAGDDGAGGRDVTEAWGRSELQGRDAREACWLAHGALDGEDGVAARAPSVVIVDADEAVRSTLLQHLGPACAAHGVAPAGAVELLQGLAVVDVALVDCDPPPSQQAPIFRELGRWPGAVCVLMSHNNQKLEQLRALGVFAPLVLDKPLQPEALEAIRAAVLEIAEIGA